MLAPACPASSHPSRSRPPRHSSPPPRPRRRLPQPAGADAVPRRRLRRRRQRRPRHVAGRRQARRAARAPWRAATGAGRSARAATTWCRAGTRARFAAALRSRGLLVYAAAQRAAHTPSRRSPTTRSRRRPTPGARRSRTRSLAPPPVTDTSPLIALVDARLDETHPEFAGGHTSTASADRPLDSLHGTATAAVAAAPVNGVGIVGVWPGARALTSPLPPDSITLRGLGARHRAGDQRRRRRDQHELRLARASAAPSTSRSSAPSSRGIVPVAAAGQRVRRGQPARVPRLAAARAHRRRPSTRDDSAVVLQRQRGASTSSRPGVEHHHRGAARLRHRRRRPGRLRSSLDGTSFSAPMVAAAVALGPRRRPDLTPDQVAQVVRLSATRHRQEGLRRPRPASACSTSARALAKPPPPRGPARAQRRPPRSSTAAPSARRAGRLQRPQTAPLRRAARRLRGPGRRLPRPRPRRARACA